MNKEDQELKEELNNQPDGNPEANAPEQAASETAENNGQEDPNAAISRERDEWKDKYLRLYAEFDNFRKRSSREKAEFAQFASADLMKELLPVVDDFERAMMAAQKTEDQSSILEGFSLIHHKFLRTLEQKGLKHIESNHKPFDVDFHEAITKIPAPSDDLKGKVLDTVEKGYSLHDRVIRFAKVVIGE